MKPMIKYLVQSGSFYCISFGLVSLLVQPILNYAENKSFDSVVVSGLVFRVLFYAVFMALFSLYLLKRRANKAGINQLTEEVFLHHAERHFQSDTSAEALMAELHLMGYRMQEISSQPSKYKLSHLTKQDLDFSNLELSFSPLANNKTNVIVSDSITSKWFKNWFNRPFINVFNVVKDLETAEKKQSNIA